jgi:hypothetical protein
LLASSFRPVTADVLVSLLAFYQKQQCVMPGALLQPLMLFAALTAQTFVPPAAMPLPNKKRKL